MHIKCHSIDRLFFIVIAPTHYVPNARDFTEFFGFILFKKPHKWKKQLKIGQSKYYSIVHVHA